MSDLGNKKTMAKNINRYLYEKDMTAADLARALDLSYTTVREWAAGRSYPRIDKIEMMANFFGISKSDLVEQPKQETDIDRYIKDENLQRLVLYAGRNIPEQSRAEYVDALIATIKVLKTNKNGND